MVNPINRQGETAMGFTDRCRSILTTWKYRVLVWFVDKPDALARRVRVENKLLSHATAGSSASPNECKELAAELGVPDWLRMRRTARPATEDVPRAQAKGVPGAKAGRGGNTLRQNASQRFVHVLEQHGIYKRIDENRELLELLLDRAPQLLVDAPWVEGWIKSQDAFLEALLDCPDKPWSPTASLAPFPRPWPVRDTVVSPADAHTDDAAVNRFAVVMKAKLAISRAKGRAGWDGPSCSAQILSRMLVEHVEKGDPIDVAVFSMMLHERGERIERLPLQAGE